MPHGIQITSILVVETNDFVGPFLHEVIENAVRSAEGIPSGVGIDEFMILNRNLGLTACLSDKNDLTIKVLFCSKNMEG